MKKILLYGPLSKVISGGFDRMNMNTYNLFKNDEEIKIIKMPMMKMKLKGKLKLILYPLFYFISFLYSFLYLIYYKIKYKPDVLHITAVTTFIYRDIFILLLAKILSIKIIYDIRAGLFISNYNSKIKRFIYNRNFSISNLILVEGKKYISFLKSKGFNTVYLPNYTSIEKNYTNNIYTSNKIIKFIYIGRVNKSKGITDSIRILKHLKNKYNIKLKFTVIGGYDEKYFKELAAEFGEFMINVDFKGYMNKNEIDKNLKDSDFFMFLSNWHGEGHSNSINESMSYGIPLFFYDQGFTKEIIENNLFLLENLNLKINIKDYGYKILNKSVDKIYSIIKNESLINKEKNRLIEIVKDNYSLEKMKPYLKKIYNSI